jgi:hypothetical protein
LADIEWWRVVDGQCGTDTSLGSGTPEHNQDQDQNQVQEVHLGVDDTGSSVLDEDAERQLAVLTWADIQATPEVSIVALFTFYFNDSLPS